MTHTTLCFRSLLALLLILGGCASPNTTLKENETVRQSEALRVKGNLTDALDLLAAARVKDPDNLELLAEQRRLLDLFTSKTLQDADKALQQGDDATATALLQDLAQRDPGNIRAEEGLNLIDVRALHRAWLDKARALAKDDPASALDWLSKILSEEPDWQEAVKLRDQLLRESQRDSVAAALPPALKKPVRLSFRNQSLNTIFSVISNMTGINFVIDREVPSGLTGTIETRSASAWDAINLLLATNRLSKKLLNGNTLLIYPARPDKTREYQDLGVRTFYLSNAEPKQVLATLKQVLKPRELAIDERLNAVVMRDEPAVLDAAERVVQALDIPQSEVMFDVEVLDVSTNLARNLGINYPDSIGIGFVNPTGGTTPSGGQTSNFSVGSTISLQDLRDISGKKIGLTFGKDRGPGINLNQENNQVRTLANPRIRVKNHEKAEIKIGEKVPAITTTNSGNSNFAGESVNYVEVGLTLTVTPSISLGRDITVKIELSVTDILSQGETAGGVTFYRMSNRAASTVMSTRDNETQVLGGLIKRGGIENRTGLPYASSVPLLDSLFGTHSNSNADTEIVLLITPHIVRRFNTPPSPVTRFIMGPESRMGDPLELHEGAAPVTVAPGAAAPAPTVPPPPPPASLPDDTRRLPPPEASSP